MRAETMSGSALPRPTSLLSSHHRFLRRMFRVVCGKRLPQTWNTVLVLLSVHMYLTVPVILAAGIDQQLTGLLRPYREIQQRGILLGEIDDELLEIFYEQQQDEQINVQQ